MIRETGRKKNCNSEAPSEERMQKPLLHLNQSSQELQYSFLGLLNAAGIFQISVTNQWDQMITAREKKIKEKKN